MGVGASRAVPARHRSLHSRVPARARFMNRTGVRVRVEWLDYDGEPRAYAVLRPGGVHQQESKLGPLSAVLFTMWRERASTLLPTAVLQESYCLHPWQFSAADRAEGEVVLVSRHEQVGMLC